MAQQGACQLDGSVLVREAVGEEGPAAAADDPNALEGGRELPRQRAAFMGTSPVICMHAYTHIYMYVYIYTYTYLYIHI